MYSDVSYSRYTSDQVGSGLKVCDKNSRSQMILLLSFSAVRRHRWKMW